MTNDIQFLTESLDKIQTKGISQGVFTPRDKKDIKALDELAEMMQDRIDSAHFETLFNFRCQIADLLNSELSIHSLV